MRPIRRGPRSLLKRYVVIVIILWCGFYLLRNTSTPSVDRAMDDLAASPADISVSWGNYDIDDDYPDALIMDNAKREGMILRNTGTNRFERIPIDAKECNFDMFPNIGNLWIDFNVDGKDEIILVSPFSHSIFSEQSGGDSSCKIGKLHDDSSRVGLIQQSTRTQGDDSNWCGGYASMHDLYNRGKPSLLISCIGDRSSLFVYDQKQGKSHDFKPSNDRIKLPPIHRHNFVLMSDFLMMNQELTFLFIGSEFPFQSLSSASRNVSHFPRSHPTNLPRDFFESYAIMDVAIIDVDGNMLPDLVIIGAGWKAARNVAGLIIFNFALQDEYRFELLLDDVNDCHHSAHCYSSSVVVGDFDNDMRVDIAINRRNLMAGDGGTFIEPILFIQRDGVHRAAKYSNLFSVPGDPIPSKDRGELSLVDFNLDGFLDAPLGSSLIDGYFGVNKLIGSEDENHWIELEFLSTQQPPHLIGGAVYVTAEDGTKQVRNVQAGNHRGGSDSRKLHFGLGHNEMIKEINIVWPIREYNYLHTQRYTDIPVDQLLIIYSSWITPLPSHIGKLKRHPMELSGCIESDHVRLKPTIFLLGVWKTGTTALYQTLLQHPRIQQPSMKEPHFWTTWLDLGEDWYSKQFPCGSTDRDFTIDASASYFTNMIDIGYFKRAMTRSKLIVMVRNPIDRAFSHFKMNVYHGNYDSLLAKKSPSLVFDDIVRAEASALRKCLDSSTYHSAASLSSNSLMQCSSTSLLRVGLYHYHLNRWLQAGYQLSDFLIIDFQDWKERPRRVLTQLLEHIGVEEPGYEFPEIVLDNVAKQVDFTVDTKTKDLLQQFFREENLKFFKLINRDFGW